MHIDDYNFGHIVIDGKEYHTDILICPNKEIKTNWKRAEGHELSPEDLEGLDIDKPDIVIIGTGYSGLLRIKPETKKLLQEKNIELQEAKTREATQSFNELARLGDKKIMAGFHLTC